MRLGRTRVRRESILAVTSLLAFLILGLLGAWGYWSLTGLGCDDEERAVYGEFPQFGGREITPDANSETGACFVTYETRASREEVQRYYAERLRANGWKITLLPSEEELAPPEKTTMLETVPGEPGKTREVPIGDGGDLISAERDGFFYLVSFESLEDYIEPRPGLHVAVHVGEE